MVQISIATASLVILPEAYKNFEDFFSIKNAGYLAPHKDYEYVINLIDYKQPPYRPIYKLSKKKFSIFQAYIDKYLANKFIRPSKSPTNTPILFISKLNRGLQLFVNYRDFNNLIIKNRYLFPLVGGSLDKLGRAKQFIKLDLTNAYYGIHIKKGDEWKTNFQTCYRHYKYCIMPFGLTNAPVTFQLYINKYLAKKLDVFVVVYLNNIIIYTNKKKVKYKEAVK